MKYRDDKEEYPYNLITIEEEKELLLFTMPLGSNLVANTEIMCKIAYPNKFLKEIRKHSNVYTLKQATLPPRIPKDINKPDGATKPNPYYLRPDRVKEIFPHELLIFFATIHYMGYCQLPSKRIYFMKWDRYECVPRHWMTKGQFGRDRFKYIWHNINLDCQPDPGNKSVDLDVTDKGDSEIIPEEEEEEENKEKEEDLLEDKKMRRERTAH